MVDFEDEEILDEVEQPLGRGGGADRGFQRDAAGLGLIVDALPFLVSVQGAIAEAPMRASSPLDNSTKPLGAKDLRDRVAIVADLSR